MWFDKVPAFPGRWFAFILLAPTLNGALIGLAITALFNAPPLERSAREDDRPAT